MEDRIAKLEGELAALVWNTHVHAGLITGVWAAVRALIDLHPDPEAARGAVVASIRDAEGFLLSGPHATEGVLEGLQLALQELKPHDEPPAAPPHP